MLHIFIRTARAAPSGDDALRQAIAGFTPSGIYAVFDAFSKWVLVFAIIAAVIGFLAAGYILVSSQGNAERAASGKKTFLWTAIGLVVILVSRSLVVLIGKFL